MKTKITNTTSTTEQDAPQQSQEDLILLNCEQLALPLTEQERSESWKYLSKLHRANRFRLMFGQPLLPEKPTTGTSH